MSQRTAAVAAASTVLVLLCFGAAFLGARLGAPEVEHHDVRPVSASSLRERIDELNRQLGYLEGRARKLEEGQGTALALGADNQTRIEALERALVVEDVAEPQGPAAEDDETHEETSVDTEPETPKTLEERLKEPDPLMPQALATARVLLPARLRLLADTTREGIENRRTQSYAEAQQFAVALGIGGESADEVRRQFIEHMERSAEAIGPYVRHGLEEADPEQVKKQFEHVWTQMDAGLEKLLDEETWINASKMLDGQRDLLRTVLDEHRDRRLDGR